VDELLHAADPGRAVTWLTERCGIEVEAAETIVSYLGAGRATLGLLPTQTALVFERFFDETGGMQLVIHSPWGGRVNRAMGYALRKKFCRSFNFELQASADDDTVVISLGPHHSFPLDDVVRFINPTNIRETLTQAVLDQPIFLSRWRWNLNRALIVLRFRGGRKNPPPIQRMESDDLMAALFPGAAACQENITGPIEVPEHPIVAQTVHDSLTEPLDVDGLIDLWRRIGDGEVTVHFRDTTEPSVLAHEILTARPYAFLDDGEAIDRRTNAVPIRRGLPVDPTELGRLLPEAIEQVRAETDPVPSTADELHDVLSALVLTRAREDWRDLFEELRARGRAASCTTSTECWHTAESAAVVGALFNGAGIVADVAADAQQVDDATVELVRGHLEMYSPVTAPELAQLTGLRESTMQIGLATLEGTGFAIQGSFTEADLPEPQWCSRRLLSRMHSYSRGRRRREVEPVSAERFMRFLLRWQHVAPGSQVSGPAGLSVVLGQLQGASASLAAWEPDVLAARVSDYDQRWLDELCMAGELCWLRLTPPQLADPEQRGSGPSRATPVSLVFREDLEWMVEAVRGAEQPESPAAGAVTEILEAIDSRGACFAGELAELTGRMPAEIEDALWQAAARGLLSSDGFAAIRALSLGERPRRKNAPRMSRLRRGGRVTGKAAGRWSRVPAAGETTDRDELAEALAEQLLVRWGVVFYDIAAHEGAAMRWREIQWALRRMEDRGQVRGGRFVNGFSGEQFAHRDAVEGLKAIRRLEDSERTVTLSAADPLNLTGVILPGERVPARRGETIEMPV
ncbi:MAG: Lhr family helicase, partial [Microthrixaceae bacterium]